MRRVQIEVLFGVCLVAVAAACGGARSSAPATATPTSAPAPVSTSKPVKPAEGVEVLLCDGKTTTVVPKGSSGTAIAGAIMAEWLRKNPNSHWEAEERERRSLEPSADNRDLVGDADGQTYGRITKQDVALWRAETERAALAGAGVFHDAGQLGSTNGVSCDMCHPNAANTHPETYPKFQPQLGHVALLRDMINWCIEHPVRGTALSADDPRMRALEAYILAQRKGKKLDYGRR
jgi:thiosulfate dehydrogenase